MFAKLNRGVDIKYLWWYNLHRGCSFGQRYLIFRGNYE